MGGLTSGPSAPPPPPIIVQQPPPLPDSGPTGSDGDSEVDASEQREENLLRRDRGRFGTVRTGFRGLLGLSDVSGQRKSLLGE